jgi:hypothetical protein
MKTRFTAFLLVTAAGLTTMALPAHADSFTVNGPGIRVQEHRGWFGRNSASYDDALGDSIGHRQGLFHRSERAGILGNQAEVRRGPFGSSVNVHGPDGRPMVNTERHWYGANNTTIDGNNIIHSMRNILGTPNSSGGPQQSPTPNSAAP